MTQTRTQSAGMKRIYISGPITGMPALNFPAFHAEAARLRALGYDVVNPAELCADIDGNWAECMRRDIAQLVTCDGIALLPGWRTSRGASLEVHIAEALGMTCRPAEAYLTRCEIPVNASPIGGSMGAEQPAAAGLAAEIGA